MEWIEKKEFAAVVLDSKYKVFVIYIAALSLDWGDEVYPSKKNQIAYLKVDEALFKMSSIYADFVDVFSPKFAAEFSKHMEINNYAIKSVDN